MTEKEYPPSKGEQRQMMFKHWWKTDNPEWVAQRKREWKIIKANAYGRAEAELIKSHAHFYVYGDVLPRIYMGARLEGRIDSCDRLFMTPYETADQLKQLFESFSFNGKQKILLDFLIATNRLYRGLPAEVARHDIRLFIQEVQGNHFAPWTVSGNVGRPEVVTIRGPGVSAFYYAITCIEWLCGDIAGDYFYVVDAVSYFIGALFTREQIEDNDLERLQKKIGELVSIVMESKDKPLEGYKRVLVDNLYAAFTAERVPLYIRQALQVHKH